ncbi:uncharacterized protein LOC110828962 [Zootermopsis nevadensis]|uniref:MADF domain-containing protein n=1 Tax=Zootermopsis nevadensis TaxID=136037 RepID=A0A067RA73_ZOONE|nr:uncharacterized protein LOC110828962 [Zootermopsis nevadensis]KDR20478.1 hypothetical protein L798_04777 [Zootermopsis nevadensis]
MELNTTVFDSERLISEVEKRPALYNKVMPEYSDKNYKEKQWKEVCEAVLPNWCHLDKKERVTAGNVIQRKWRNIRDNFRKGIQVQKKSTGQGARKRRKYVYFDQLLFLLPTLQERSSSGNENETEEDINTGRQVRGVTNANETNERRQSKRSKITYEESLLQIIKERNRDDIDEDKSFLLSLVPSFKKLSDEQKYIAKVEFLNVLRRVTLPQPQYPFSTRRLSNSYFPPNFPPSNPPGINQSFSPKFKPQHTESLRSPEQSTSTSSSTLLPQMSPSDSNTMSPLSDTELH